MRVPETLLRSGADLTRLLGNLGQILLLGFIILIAAGIATLGGQVVSNADTLVAAGHNFVTQAVVPVFQDIVKPVLDALTFFYNQLVCFWNVFKFWKNVIIFTLIEEYRRCEPNFESLQNLGNVILAILEDLVVDSILTFNFRTQNPVLTRICDRWQTFIQGILDLVECLCPDLTFSLKLPNMFTIVSIDSLGSQQFWDVVEAAVNSAFALVNLGLDIIEALINLLGGSATRPDTTMLFRELCGLARALVRLLEYNIQGIWDCFINAPFVWNETLCIVDTILCIVLETLDAILTTFINIDRVVNYPTDSYYIDTLYPKFVATLNLWAPPSSFLPVPVPRAPETPQFFIEPIVVTRGDRNLVDCFCILVRRAICQAPDPLLQRCFEGTGSPFAGTDFCCLFDAALRLVVDVLSLPLELTLHVGQGADRVILWLDNQNSTQLIAEDLVRIVDCLVSLLRAIPLIGQCLAQVIVEAARWLIGIAEFLVRVVFGIVATIYWAIVGPTIPPTFITADDLALDAFVGINDALVAQVPGSFRECMCKILNELFPVPPIPCSSCVVSGFVEFQKRLLPGPTEPPLVGCTGSTPCFDLCCFARALLDLGVLLLNTLARSLNGLIQGNPDFGYWACTEVPCFRDNVVQLIRSFVKLPLCLCRFINLVIPVTTGRSDLCCLFQRLGELLSCIFEITFNSLYALITEGGAGYPYFTQGQFLIEIDQLFDLTRLVVECLCNLVNGVFPLNFFQATVDAIALDICCIPRVILLTIIEAGRLLVKSIVNIALIEVNPGAICWWRLDTPEGCSGTLGGIGFVAQSRVVIGELLGDASLDTECLLACGRDVSGENKGIAGCICQILNTLLPFRDNPASPVSCDPLAPNCPRVDLCCPFTKLSVFLSTLLEVFVKGFAGLWQSWEPGYPEFFVSYIFCDEDPTAPCTFPNPTPACNCGTFECAAINQALDSILDPVTGLVGQCFCEIFGVVDLVAEILFNAFGRTWPGCFCTGTDSIVRAFSNWVNLGIRIVVDFIRQFPLACYWTGGNPSIMTQDDTWIVRTFGPFAEASCILTGSGACILNSVFGLPPECEQIGRQFFGSLITWAFEVIFLIGATLEGFAEALIPPEQCNGVNCGANAGVAAFGINADAIGNILGQITQFPISLLFGDSRIACAEICPPEVFGSCACYNRSPLYPGDESNPAYQVQISISCGGVGPCCILQNPPAFPGAPFAVDLCNQFVCSDATDQALICKPIDLPRCADPAANLQGDPGLAATAQYTVSGILFGFFEYVACLLGDPLRIPVDLLLNFLSIIWQAWNAFVRILISITVFAFSLFNISGDCGCHTLVSGVDTFDYFLVGAICYRCVNPVPAPCVGSGDTVFPATGAGNSEVLCSIFQVVENFLAIFEAIADLANLNIITARAEPFREFQERSDHVLVGVANAIWGYDLTECYEGGDAALAHCIKHALPHEFPEHSDPKQFLAGAAQELFKGDHAQCHEVSMTCHEEWSQGRPCRAAEMILFADCLDRLVAGKRLEHVSKGYFEHTLFYDKHYIRSFTSKLYQGLDQKVAQAGVEYESIRGHGKRNQKAAPTSNVEHLRPEVRKMIGVWDRLHQRYQRGDIRDAIVRTQERVNQIGFRRVFLPNPEKALRGVYMAFKNTKPVWARIKKQAKGIVKRVHPKRALHKGRAIVTQAWEDVKTGLHAKWSSLETLNRLSLGWHQIRRSIRMPKWEAREPTEVKETGPWFKMPETRLHLMYEMAQRKWKGEHLHARILGAACDCPVFERVVDRLIELATYCFTDYRPLDPGPTDDLNTTVMHMNRKRGLEALVNVTAGEIQFDSSFSFILGSVLGESTANQFNDIQGGIVDFFTNNNTDITTGGPFGFQYWAGEFLLNCPHPQSVDCSLGVGLVEALETFTLPFAVAIAVLGFINPLLSLGGIIVYGITILASAYHYSPRCLFIDPFSTVPLALPQCFFNDICNLFNYLFRDCYVGSVIPECIVVGGDCVNGVIELIPFEDVNATPQVLSLYYLLRLSTTLTEWLVVVGSIALQLFGLPDLAAALEDALVCAQRTLDTPALNDCVTTPFVFFFTFLPSIAWAALYITIAIVAVFVLAWILAQASVALKLLRSLRRKIRKPKKKKRKRKGFVRRPITGPLFRSTNPK